MRKRLFLGVLVAAVSLYFAFRGMSLRETFFTLLTAKPQWLLLAGLIYFCGFCIRTLRWRYLLEPIKKISAGELFPVLMIGFLANNILPLRMGEFVRADLTGRKFKISRSASLGTIFLERLLDMLAFLTTFAVSAFAFAFPPKVKSAAETLAALCLAAAIGIVVMAIKTHWVESLADFFPAPAALKERALHFLRNFTQGISGMVKPNLLLSALALSLVAWLIEGTVLYVIAHAFALPLAYAQAFFLLFFLGLAVTLPQAPGYVGTMELFGVTALHSLGFPKDTGLPVILAIHGFEFLFVCIVGIWALWKEGLSFQTLFRQSQNPKLDINQ